jgi:hypothetical protein
MGPGRREEKQKTGPKARPENLLLANAELVDDGAIALEVRLLEVIEKAAAPADELQKAAAAVMILRVRLEVLGQVGDSIGKKRNLHFRGASVALVDGVLGDEASFLFFGGRQNPVSFNRLSVPVDTRKLRKVVTITAEVGKNNPAPVEWRNAGRARARHPDSTRANRRILPKMGYAVWQAATESVPALIEALESILPADPE